MDLEEALEKIEDLEREVEKKEETIQELVVALDSISYDARDAIKNI